MLSLTSIDPRYNDNHIFVENLYISEDIWRIAIATWAKDYWLCVVLLRHNYYMIFLGSSIIIHILK